MLALLAGSGPLMVFVFVGLFSPGPNVVMLTTSGARFGFRATLPHLLGVPVGTALLAAAAGAGVTGVLLAKPGLKLGFQIIAAVWILWLAWRTAQAGQVARGAAGDRPFRFAEAVMFQAVNPKVWAVTLAAAAGYGIGLPPAGEALRQAVIFGGLNLGVCLFWTGLGHHLSRYLQAPHIWRWFMRAMALLIALSAVLIFI